MGERGLVPNFLKPTIRKIYYSLVDMIDTLKGRDSLTPPKSLMFIGGGDYKEIGNEFKGYFIKLGGLKPDHRVLDVGCGVGRMAVPLTDYLSREGGYWGFDIVQKGIEWCQKHIMKNFNNFQFLHVDIYNKYYNKKGKLTANQFCFPYETDFFNFVFLTSVFTHMLPDELENYIKEIARVLKPGGKAFLTIFMLNAESERAIGLGKGLLDFKYEITECCKTVNPKMPEYAIAYDEGFVLSLIGKYRLVVDQPVHYGSWSGRERFLTYQDVILVRKQ